MNLKRTVYVAPKYAKVAQKRKVSKIWTIICDNFETVYEIGFQLVLITNR